jgi:HK97 family phage portal protein
MPPTPRPRLRSSHQVSTRARWTRTNGDLTVGGYSGPGVNPSEPMVWYGSDQWPGGTPWNHGGWNLAFGAQVPVQPAVTRLTALITDPLSSVPWKQVEEGFGGKVLTTPRWLSDPQLLRPDNRHTVPVLPAVSKLPRGQFFASWIRTAVWHGQSGMIFTEDADGQPSAGSMRLIHPQFLTSVRDEQTGTLLWEIGEGNETVRADRDGYIHLGNISWRLVVLRDPHAPVEVDGRSVSVFERHASAFGLADEIGTYMGSVYRGNGVPNGILRSVTPGLTQEQADALKQAWMRAHGDTRSIAVLNSTTEFTPLARSPVDTALIEGKRAVMADMCLAFSLDPLAALGISMGNSATYTSAMAWFEKLKQDLLVWVGSVEEIISSLLPAGRGIRMDFTELTRPDPKTHYEALKVALDAGIFTPEEARNAIGLPPMVGGSQSPDEQRSLSAAETSQKVYLAVTAGVLTVQEARQMIADAGGKLDPAVVPAVPEPEPGSAPSSAPASEDEQRSRFPSAWRH